MHNENKNDPFKKMDLNFDPTQETKVSIEEKKEEIKTPIEEKTTPTPEPVVQQPKPIVEEKPTPIVEPIIEEKPKVIDEQDLPKTVSKLDLEQPVEQPKQQDSTTSMDKTLEFIIQNDPINTDLTVDDAVEAKKYEKMAKKKRRISFFWVFIAFLTIIFSAVTIINYAGIIKEYIDILSNDSSTWKIIEFTILRVILQGFEPLLYIFFILLSMTKYHNNHKVYVQWWDDTEPLRVAEELKKEKELNTKYIQKFNALDLHNTYTRQHSDNDHEELANLKDENKYLLKKIKEKEKELSEKAAEAKAAEKAAKSK